MAGVHLYPAEPRIHGPDVCKDAIEATPRINVVVSNPPNTLFEKSMRVFGFKTCASYKSVLDTVKAEIFRDIPGHVIQLPINRLKRTFLSSDIQPKTLPSNIKGAFYDSGPSPQSYKADITQYNTLASFTDPGPSSYIPGNTLYPAQDLTFPDDTFDKMFPNGIISIKNFRGILNAEYSSATLSFDIHKRGTTEGPTHRIIVDFVNSNNTDGSYNIRINDLVHPDLKCFHGNPTKNAFFNTNSIKGGDQDKILYGVLYIFCKEFCGDILIGLIAKHYDNLRKQNPALPDYALVTGDGTLEAYSCFLQVNHIAKNHSRAGLEEAIVRMFAPPTPGQLLVIAIEEKAKVLDKIIEWNTLIYNACLHVSKPGVSKPGVDIVDIKPVTPPIRKIFTDFSKYIENINTYLHGVRGSLAGNEESISEFMKKYKSYEVKNVFKSVTADEAILMRGIYDPFKYVPPHIDRAGFPVIDKEFLNYLISNKGKARGGGTLEEDLRIGNISFQPLEANTDEYLNKYLKDPESLINKDPTTFLKNIISDILIKIPVDPKTLDVEDVYNFIFTIYDKECKISYNKEVIGALIIFLLNGKCLTENEFDFYNTLLGTASTTYRYPPEHNILPVPNAPAGVEAEPWTFPPANADNMNEGSGTKTPTKKVSPAINLNELVKSFIFGSAPLNAPPGKPLPPQEAVTVKGKRKGNFPHNGFGRQTRRVYFGERPVIVGGMDGGRRKTIRRKKRAQKTKRKAKGTIGRRRTHKK